MRRALRAFRGFIRGNLLPGLGFADPVQIARKVKLDLRSRLLCDRSGSIQAASGAHFAGARLYVGRGALLEVQDSCSIRDSILTLGDSCWLRIGPGSQFRGVNLRISDQGIVDLGPGAVFDSGDRPLGVVVEGGSFTCGPRVNIKGDITVRFGGRLEIGSYTSLGLGSQIRCEDNVQIGEYCLISYDVIIYDTNAHSVDWKQRRQRIEAGYPIGTGEIVRPKTKPIVIGNDVWIGMRSLVLKGASIGDRAIVGMGTAVTGSIPEDSVAVSERPRIIWRAGTRVPAESSVIEVD
jgi:acetyltransferase-like isoleucine patch superfamily enzyme